MHGPSEEARQQIVGMLQATRDLPDLIAEQRLLEALNAIEIELRRDLEERPSLDSETVAYAQLGAIESWASVVSSAVARVYAPTSPWRRKVAGWASHVAARIRWLANLLLTPLAAVANFLGARSWSIGLNFPWGVSVSLTWQ